MNKQLQTKKEAIQTVRKNNESYYELSLDLARVWVAKQFKTFSSEDFRDHCELILGQCREPRVFGAVFKSLINEKRIFEHGASTARNKQAHGRLIRVYISREYKERQSKNATKDRSLNLFDD